MGSSSGELLAGALAIFFCRAARSRLRTKHGEISGTIMQMPS